MEIETYFSGDDDRFEITIETDENPCNPRQEFDNAGVLYCEHRRYILGDLKAEDPRNVDPKEIAVALPVYLIDHSGLSIRCHSFRDVDPGEWDSGQVGVIYVTREMVLSEWGWKRLTSNRRALIERVLLSEIEEYDNYLTGDVYGYIIKDTQTGETVDSCWGFYGYSEVARLKNIEIPDSIKYYTEHNPESLALLEPAFPL